MGQLAISAMPIAGAVLLAAASAHAQDGTGANRSWVVVPRLTISETFTNNVRLASSGQQAEQITELSPGINLKSNSPRLNGYLDFALSELAYAQGSSSNLSQKALSTSAAWEAIDNWAYLDFNGTISQQALSALGTQSISNGSVNDNKTQVSSYMISPYVQGRLGTFAGYNARLSRVLTQSANPAGSGVASTSGSVSVNSDSTFKDLGWQANVSRQSVNYSAGRLTEDDQWRLGLTYSVTPQFSVSANGGYEQSNFTSADKQGYATQGFGVSWAPSERTKISASKSKRSFGDANTLTIEHRTARTAWKYSDSKDVSEAPSQSILPANNGVGNAPVVSGFLTTALALQRRQDISVSLLGIRDTVTLAATKTQSSRADTVSTSVDDLSNSELSQQGFSAQYSHRLSPDYLLTATGSQQKTSAISNTQDTRLKQLNLSLNAKIGRATNATVGVRRVIFDSTSSPYGETAMTFTLTVQF